MSWKEGKWQVQVVFSGLNWLHGFIGWLCLSLRFTILQNNFYTTVYQYWRTHYLSFTNFAISRIVFYHPWAQKTYQILTLISDVSWLREQNSSGTFRHMLVDPMCSGCAGVSCGTALRTARLISSHLTHSWLRWCCFSKWQPTLHMCITMSTFLFLCRQIFMLLCFTQSNFK